MAKKRGFFGTLGTLFRVAVVVLAGILVYAIWQNYTQPDVVAETGETAQEGEQPLEQALEAADTDEVVSDAVQEELEEAANTELPDTESVDVREEIATATGDAVDSATALDEQAQDAIAKVTEDAEEAAASASDMASDLREEAEETVANLAEEAEQAAGDVKDKAENALNSLLKPEGDAASSTAALQVPGDDTAYTMIEATRADDGSIEVISQKTGEDMMLSRVTCAPLTLGVMATGATPEALEARVEPEMARLVLGTPEAALAAYACGAVE